MPLTSKLTEYDDRWPRLFEKEAQRLRSIFDGFLVAMDHIGSTAVKGLIAKPEIDILATVSETIALDEWQHALAPLGYKRGGDLIEGHHFFKRDVDGVRTHKLHVCALGHPQIDRMLGIRDHLRANAQDRAAYALLKLRLEQENQTGIAEYLAAKAPFLDELFAKIRAQED